MVDGLASSSTLAQAVVDAGRKGVLEQNKTDADDLAADEEFVTAMGRAKWLFMTKGEVLIHGDLHTGSVMVCAPEGSTRCDSVKAVDSEYAFRTRWPDRRDPRMWREPLLEQLLANWNEESRPFATSEMSRRIVGAAKTKDIETLPAHLASVAADTLRKSRTS